MTTVRGSRQISAFPQVRTAFRSWFTMAHNGCLRPRVAPVLASHGGPACGPDHPVGEALWDDHGYGGCVSPERLCVRGSPPVRTGTAPVPEWLAQLGGMGSEAVAGTPGP